MKHRKFTFLCILLFCVVSLFLLSCNLFQKNEAPIFSGDFGWATSDVDPTYWTKRGDTAPATAFRGFWVYVDDPDGYQDITEIDVIHPNGVDTWYIEGHYNSEDGYWGGWYYYDNDTPNTVELGTYTVVVRDSANHEITGNISFNSPGSSSGSGFIYSEDYSGSTTGSVAMIHRASNLSGTKNLSDLSISFTVSDNRVINGGVLFYDSSASYITWSGLFKNTINSGGVLKTDGNTNTLQISSVDLDLGGFTFGDIAGFHVCLTDGAQYAPVETYDHRSISEYVQF
jgi:hypothetical protein